MNLDSDITDKIFYILINVGVVAFLNYYFTKKLKKQELKFSLYNEIQIESLRNIYKILTTFKFITIKIKENSKVDFDFYRVLIDNWLNSYLDLTNTLSQEKYILPKEIKSSYSETIEELNYLKNYLNLNAKFKENFETHFDGMEYKNTIKLYVEDDYAEGLSRKIQEFESVEILNSIINKIEILRNKIEIEFENMK